MGSNFRRTLIDVAEKAHREKKITRDELWAIRMLTFRPADRRSLEEECCRQAMAVGVLPSSAGTDTAVDWSSLFDFLFELLDKILKFLNP